VFGLGQQHPHDQLVKTGLMQPREACALPCLPPIRLHMLFSCRLLRYCKAPLWQLSQEASRTQSSSSSSSSLL